MVSTVLLIGASRGIGYALGQRYIEAGWTVITTARSSPPKPLPSPHRHIVCDASSPSDVDKLARELGNTALDQLWYVAAIFERPDSLESVTPDAMQRVFATNAFGPFFAVRALLPNLKKSPAAKVILVTSREGSMGDNGSGGHYMYRSSKAALHAVGKNLSIDLAKLCPPVPVLLLHPGMVETSATLPMLEQMQNRPPGIIKADECAQHLFQRADELAMDKTGTLMHRDGYAIEW